MPRAAELARNRREGRRAALQAEREREQLGYSLTDTTLMRPTRDGHASVMAVQSRPLGTVDFAEPFQETGALRGHAIADPTLTATAHLLTSTFRFEGDGWMSQVLRDSHLRVVEPHKEMGQRLGRNPTIYPASGTAAFPVREAAEERWSGTLRNPKARWKHEEAHKPKIPPPSWGATSPTFGGGALGPDPVPKEDKYPMLPQLMSKLASIDLSSVASSWNRQPDGTVQQGYMGEDNRDTRKVRRAKPAPKDMAEYVHNL